MVMNRTYLNSKAQALLDAELDDVVELAHDMMLAWEPLRDKLGCYGDWEFWWDVWKYPLDHVDRWDLLPGIADGDLEWIAEHQDDEPDPIEFPGMEILFPED